MCAHRHARFACCGANDVHDARDVLAFALLLFVVGVHLVAALGYAALGYFRRMTDPMLQFFAYAHLAEDLQAISKPYAEMADNLVATLPRNAERTVALRKLLESKDCAVRAKLFVG